jgi:HAD superfamily hydrolase (TIGR01484 family)
MRYLALCCDYDGTLAHHGRLDAPTIAALERFKKSGRRLVMVTGRELDELQTVCSRLDLFDRIIAENGAVLYRPESREELLLGERPPDAFVAALKAKGVERISVGRVIVATWEPHEQTVLETIREMGLELQVIFNKGAVMVLPAGVNKATGLRAALDELNLSEHNAVGIGDAENDHAFLGICECSVAVANALPSLQERADIVTRADHGAGVAELIDEILADDLAHREAALIRHHVVLGKTAQGASVRLSPYGINALVVGTSGGGKSSVAAGLIERLRANGYSYCVIDPEGDYDALEATVVLGSPERAPTIDECVQLIAKPQTNVVINLLDVKLEDRPHFYLSLFARIQDVRAHTGRPHVLIVDEAHHVLPADWQPAAVSIPECLDGVLLVSVTPSLVAPSILRALDTVVVLGDKPRQMLAEFATANGRSAPPTPQAKLEPGFALLWSKSAQQPPLLVHLEPTKTERRRHLRKYAQGELPAAQSFFFRGPHRKLNLRAHNLILFMELADGVDEDTWLFHLRRGEYSHWIRDSIKDPDLADRVAEIEQRQNLDAVQSRREIRHLIEEKYTLPSPSPGVRTPSPEGGGPG